MVNFSFIQLRKIHEIPAKEIQITFHNYLSINKFNIFSLISSLLIYKGYVLIFSLHQRND